MTFFKAWRAWTGFRGEIPERAWLYGIANRIAIDAMRRRRCRPVGCSLEDDQNEWSHFDADESLDPARQVLDGERLETTRAAVQGALALLSPDQQQLISLYYFEELPYTEISTRLGIPYQDLKSRLYRIRQRVRRDLALSPLLS